MHPNHQQNNRNLIAPVHSSNNRLYNNTVFHNNQYTFSLNRDGDGGYLDSRPLSSASLYSGEGGRVSRGTKSDIGVRCRRPSSSSTTMKHLTHSNSITTSQHNQQSSALTRHKSKIPSVKSDFLLSYLSNAQQQQQQQQNVSLSAYHISSGVSDYLENYKAGAADARLMYSNNKIDQDQIFSNHHKQSHHHQQQQQQLQQHHHQQQHHQLQSNHRINSNDLMKQQRNHVNNYNASHSNANLGPLLYLDSDLSNRTRSITNTTSTNNALFINQSSMQNVSRPFNAACLIHRK